MAVEHFVHDMFRISTAPETPTRGSAQHTRGSLKNFSLEARNQIPAGRFSSQSDALRPFLAFERARPHDFELLTHS